MQATSPAPYPITVASSTSAAWAANGAIAVANAAKAAALGLASTFASALGMTALVLKAGRDDGVENADAQATITAIRRATDWKVFMVTKSKCVYRTSRL